MFEPARDSLRAPRRKRNRVLKQQEYARHNLNGGAQLPPYGGGEIADCGEQEYRRDKNQHHCVAAEYDRSQPPWGRSVAGKREIDAAEQALIGDGVQVRARTRPDSKPASQKTVQSVGHPGDAKPYQRPPRIAIEDGREHDGNQTQSREAESVRDVPDQESGYQRVHHSRCQLVKTEDLVESRIGHDFCDKRHVHGVAGPFGDHVAEERTPDQRQIADKV